MTQQEKQLLLIDLCARLPYRPKVFYEYVDDLDKKTYGYGLTLNTWCINQLEAEKAIVKPHLRSMSSMTEEEEKLYRKTQDKIPVQWDDYGQSIGYVYANTIKTFDWLNENMFDYRGLIKKGLALEAPEGMYNI